MSLFGGEERKGTKMADVPLELSAMEYLKNEVRGGKVKSLKKESNIFSGAFDCFQI